MMRQFSRIRPDRKVYIAKAFTSWLVVMAILLMGLALEAAPVVSNVTFNQRLGTKLVDVSYDLTVDGPNPTVNLEVSSDGGTTWDVPVNTVSGALGAGITAGTGKIITWDAGTDWSGQNSTQVKVRVTAWDLLGPNNVSYARIPAGSYERGNVIGDPDITDAPVQTVTLSEYYMQTTETTKAQWDLVRTWASAHGYTDIGAGAGKEINHPVHTITWYDMVKWCNAASEMEGLTPCYYTNAGQTLVYRTGNTDIVNTMVKWRANGYRLPTEAEWEVAARGGLTGKRFPWGNTIANGLAGSGGQANYYGRISESYDLGPYGYNSAYVAGGAPYTSPVGSFAANGFGLYDMSGNVWERCWDWYGVYSAGVDPLGPSNGTKRVERGGSWNDNYAGYARCAPRSGFNIPGYSAYYNGFRAARGRLAGINGVASNTGTIYTSGVISSHPQSLAVMQNAVATFSVTATGSGSLSYQWQKDGVDIPGATSSSFSLASAQPWHIGDYRVKVTDSVGTVNSEVATLSLSGVNSEIWKGLVAYYPMDGNFEDSSPRKNNLDTLNQFSLGNDRFGISNKAASINASTGKAVSKYPVGIAGNSKRSVSLWVQTNSSLNNDCDLISWSRYLSPANAQGFLMQLTAGNGGQIYVWGHYADISAKDLGDPFINQWSHIVYSYDGSTSAQGRVYLNGALLTNTLLSGDVPFITEDTALKIGDRGLGMAKSGTKIDDVRIYNRALSASDVQALYAFESNPAPTIAQHPSSQTVRVGGTVTLGVQATGAGTLTYQWRKGGVDLPQATGASLELVDLTLADAGSYDVVVSNGTASVTSNAAVLTVLHAPTISTIEDVTLSEDGTLGPLAFSIADLDTSVEQLSISATSSLPVLVQEAAIQLAGTGTSRTLTLSPVPNASGVVTITLRVSDGVLETTESFVLTVQAVPDAPTDLTLTPASLAENNAPNAVVGTLAAVDVDAGDSHSFTLVNGAGSNDNGSFSILGSNLRMMQSADYETKSTYAIRVRATDGQSLWAEKALTVTVQNVNEPPTLSGAATVSMIEDGLETRSLSVGDVDTDVATLTLSATATTNSALLPLGRVSFGGSGSSRTVTMDPVEGQAGVATLTLSVSDGELSTTATMTVTVYEKDIVIAQQPQPQEVSELSQARFSVQLSSGGEFATYQWQRNNQPIQGATQPELILPSALLSQAGNYHVVITNPQTSLASAQAVLLVRVLPEIKQQPESILVNAGDSAGFVVSALGRPTMTYQWRRNGADVSGARSASLDFSAVTMAQAGRYQVRIKNPANTTGILSREVELGVVESSVSYRVLKIQQGKVVKLSVAASGNSLTYLWHKNGSAVSYNGRNKGWDTRELTIDSITDADEGDYECQVTGPGGTAWGVVTTLVVFNQKPKIQRPLLLNDAMVGKNYEFMVPLDLDNGGEATSYTATGLPPGLKIDSSSGVISGKPTVAKAEGYFVKVTASNSVGKDEESAGIAVAPLRQGTVGTYAAIIRPVGWQDQSIPYDPELYGRLDLTVLSTAAYSGSLTLGGLKLPVSGVLYTHELEDPVGLIRIKRTGKPDIQGVFTLIPDSGKPRQLIGSILGVNEGLEHELLGWRQYWNSTVKASAFDGLYNLVEEPYGSNSFEERTDLDGNPVPASAGYLSFTVGLNGTYNMTGRTGDGEKVTCSGFLSEPSQRVQAPLYAYITATKGCLAGTLVFRAESMDGVRDAFASSTLLSWNRAAGSASSRLYKAGFSDIKLNMAGGQYVPPAKDEPLLDSVVVPMSLNNAKLDFDGGGAANQPAIIFSILADGKIAMPSSATKTTLTVTAATGMFKGSFVLTELNPFTKSGVPQTLTRTVNYEGLLVPNPEINPESPGRRAFGSGFFVTPQMPGSVTETLSNTQIRGGRVTINAVFPQ